jgi:hypothetical protein
MEESKQQQGLYRLLQFILYLLVAADVFLFVFAHQKCVLQYAARHGLITLLQRISHISVLHRPLNRKLLILTLICLTSIGTLSRKDKELNPLLAIVFPLAAGFIIFFSGLWIPHDWETGILPWLSWNDVGYSCSDFIGAVLIHIALDNISKIISSGLGKDKWNTNGESFMQPEKAITHSSSVNIPMLFYYRNKIRRGWINLDNIYRGTLLIGTPGAGKSFGVVAPFIRQLTARGFTLCVYDFKFV